MPPFSSPGPRNPQVQPCSVARKTGDKVFPGAPWSPWGPWACRTVTTMPAPPLGMTTQCQETADVLRFVTGAHRENWRHPTASRQGLISASANTQKALEHQAPGRAGSVGSSLGSCMLVVSQEAWERQTPARRGAGQAHRAAARGSGNQPASLTQGTASDSCARKGSASLNTGDAHMPSAVCPAFHVPAAQNPLSPPCPSSLHHRPERQDRHQGTGQLCTAQHQAERKPPHTVRAP